MNTKLSAAKIAEPYGQALLDFSLATGAGHQIAPNFQSLEILLRENPALMEYFNNPIISKEGKRTVLTKLLKSRVKPQTLKMLMFLVDCSRINILDAIVDSYLKHFYKMALIKNVRIESPATINPRQFHKLTHRIKKFTNSRDLNLIIVVDPSLIGGFLIDIESEVIDYTIKNQLKELAKHLNTILEI